MSRWTDKFEIERGPYTTNSLILGLEGEIKEQKPVIFQVRGLPPEECDVKVLLDSLRRIGPHGLLWKFSGRLYSDDPSTPRPIRRAKGCYHLAKQSGWLRIRN